MGQVGAGVGRGWWGPGYLGPPDRALDTEPRAPARPVIRGGCVRDITRPRLGSGWGCLRPSQPTQCRLSGVASLTEVIAQNRDRGWEHRGGAGSQLGWGVALWSLLWGTGRGPV